MSRIRVLHLLGDALPTDVSPVKMVAMLVKGIDLDRYRCEAWFLGCDGPLRQHLQTNGMSTEVIPWGRFTDLQGAWRFARRLHRTDFDIVHQHQGGMKGRIARAILRTRMRARILVHLHTYVSEAPAGRFSSMATGGADMVVAVSQAVAAHARASAARVVYPGIDLPAVSAPDASSTVVPVIGAAARLTRAKGMEHLLNALALLLPRFPSLLLEIAGDGPERPRLEEQARTLHLKSAVRFLGWLPDISPSMLRWSCLVMPSLAEGFGLAAAEAMALGLPVIASRVGGLPEFIEDGREGFLCPPGNAESLAARISFVLTNDDVRRRMGVAARERIARDFTPRAFVSTFDNLYRELLGDRTDLPAGAAPPQPSSKQQ